jgi:lysylphosphatidylglycerol synthetase-like protein (DUF2156 family)
VTRDDAGFTFAEALERLGAGIAERRAQVALALAGVAAVAAYRGLHEGTHEFAAVGLALLLLARAVALGRPIVGRHLLWSVAFLVLGHTADAGQHLVLSWTAVAAAGVVAGLPRRPPAPATDDQRRHVWALVDATSGDTLAPFALRSDKAYVFSPDRLAAVPYRVRLGTAVASGDPVGHPASVPAAIDAFVAQAEANGWRTAVLGASDRTLPLWRAHGLRAISIGRDVVIDVAAFAPVGRKFRNLRQAVQRSRNAGVTTEILVERDLTDEVRDELLEVMKKANKGLQTRGFAMILDHPLDGTHPGMLIAVARDRSGGVVGFQRYATADSGRDLSLDVPWRVPGAPNGVDERLIADMVAWGAARGVRCVSLAFAAFPDLFAVSDRTPVQQVAYRGVRALDRFIRLESLYRFVRKFHAFGAQRYVALRPVHVVWVALAALSLEFGLRGRGSAAAPRR